MDVIPIVNMPHMILKKTTKALSVPCEFMRTSRTEGRKKDIINVLLLSFSGRREEVNIELLVIKI